MWGCVLSCRQKQHVRSWLKENIQGYRVNIIPFTEVKKVSGLASSTRGVLGVCSLIIATAASVVGFRRQTEHSSRDSVR